MADNLISTISQYLTPDLRAKIAGALGMDANMANKALGAAVPAILSSLGAVAATSGGASKISEAIGSQDLSVLDNLGSSLDTDGPMGLINSGSSTLSSLVGGAGMSALTGAISKFSGADADTSGSVLGLMGPIVTGVIGQQDPNSWSSGAGIANLFASQKSNIAAALPSGLGAMLGAGAAGVAGMAGAARTSVSQSASAASSNAQTAVNKAQDGFPMWILIVGALIIAALAWYFLSRPAEKPMVAAPATPQVTAPAAPKVAAPQVAAPAMDAAAVTKSAGTMIDGLKTTLGSITDVVTAKAALPQLTAAAGELDKLSALPAAAKSGITGLVATAMPALKEQADKVLAIPGVGEVAKPTLDGLMAKLAALGK